jgi:hypothetical protein
MEKRAPIHDQGADFAGLLRAVVAPDKPRPCLCQFFSALQQGDIPSISIADEKPFK